MNEQIIEALKAAHEEIEVLRVHLANLGERDYKRLVSDLKARGLDGAAEQRKEILRKVG